MNTYEQKYKQALVKLKEHFTPTSDGIISGISRELIEDIFPELKESKDDRIRKALIRYHQSTLNIDGVKGEEILAWLEKQGEQKPANKVEPKFHKGEWIVWKNKCYKVNYNGCGYELVVQNGLSTWLEYGTVDTSARLYDVAKDAKDGDVLVDVYGNIGIFQKNDDFDWSSYCSLGSNGGFRCFAIEHELDGSHPATKEQRDLLFQKMKEVGYEWDSEKKKLKKVVVPIFNIGDTIIKKHNSDINKFGQFTITDISNGKYWHDESIICGITEQDEWEVYEPVRQTSAEWRDANLWHDAQGDDLPEIDKEVIVLLNNGKVCFAHRPYKKGYLGKSYVTGNIETFYTYTYGTGGWNIPDVKWWLDCVLPNMEEE